MKNTLYKTKNDQIPEQESNETLIQKIDKIIKNVAALDTKIGQLIYDIALLKTKF